MKYLAIAEHFVNNRRDNIKILRFIAWKHFYMFIFYMLKSDLKLY